MTASGTTLSAMPPSIRVTVSTSTNVRPATSTCAGGMRVSGCSPSTATPIALTPSHGLAEWALIPRNASVALRLPRQPAWIVLSVGSSTMARSVSRRSGQAAKTPGSGLSATGSSSRVKKSRPMSSSRSGRSRSSQLASSSMTASPPFMSVAPRPTTQPSSIRPGRLSWAGIVSRWPTSRTWGLPGRLSVE